jgi:small subunit ribosomal protein S5
MDEEKGYIEKVLQINRVAKVVKGGRRFGFSALVVVGDGMGSVGVGLGKAKEAPVAVTKGVGLAKRNMIHVPLKGGTFPFTIIGHHGRSRVLFKPASPGTGIVAGGPVRAVMEALGVKDILTKSLGRNNPINVVYATFDALKEIISIQHKERLREGA